MRALFVQRSRTSGSQPGNRGSNPLESAIFFDLFFSFRDAARDDFCMISNQEALCLLKGEALLFLINNFMEKEAAKASALPL